MHHTITQSLIEHKFVLVDQIVQKIFSWLFVTSSSYNHITRLQIFLGLFLSRIYSFFGLAVKGVILDNRMGILLGKVHPVVVLIIAFLAFDHRHFEFYFHLMFWQLFIVALFLSFLENDIISLDNIFSSIGFPSFQTDFSANAAFPHSGLLHWKSIGDHVTDGFDFALALLQRNVLFDVDHNYLSVILDQLLPETFVGMQYFPQIDQTYVEIW